MSKEDETETTRAPNPRAKTLLIFFTHLLYSSSLLILLTQRLHIFGLEFLIPHFTHFTHFPHFTLTLN
jgi:hypothetical protein